MPTLFERIRGRWPWTERASPESGEAEERVDAGGPPTTLFGSAGVEEVLRTDIGWRAISVNAGSLAALRLRHVSLDDRGEEAAPILARASRRSSTSPRRAPCRPTGWR